MSNTVSLTKTLIPTSELEALRAENTILQKEAVERELRIAKLKDDLRSQANNHEADMAQARQDDFSSQLDLNQNPLKDAAKKLSYQLNATVMRATELALGGDAVVDQLKGRCSSRKGDMIGGNPATTYFLDGEAILVISDPVFSEMGLDMEVNMQYKMLGKAAEALEESA